jgi:hypothetical protein
MTNLRGWWASFVGFFDSVLAGNMLRLVTFVCSGGIILLTLLTIYIYGRRYFRDRRIAQLQGQRLAWRGLLPKHVMLIGLSYLGFLWSSLRTVFINLDSGPTRFTWLVTVSAIAGLWGQLSLLRWQRRIYPRHDEEPPEPLVRVPVEAPDGAHERTRRRRYRPRG